MKKVRICVLGGDTKNMREALWQQAQLLQEVRHLIEVVSFDEKASSGALPADFYVALQADASAATMLKAMMVKGKNCFFCNPALASGKNDKGLSANAVIKEVGEAARIRLKNIQFGSRAA